MKVSGNVNADLGVGTRIPMKKIYTWKQEVKAFVSARCIRRCIRERLAEKGIKIDPLQMIGAVGRQQLGDIGDPIQYIDDDLFGFLHPSEPPRRRSAPIKISHLIALQHTEIKTEFAARFPREFLPEYQTGDPVPFEIELAEWLGRLDIIVSSRVGRFGEDELTDEMKTNPKVQKSESGYSLPPQERKERLKAFLEILLWEGWQFPRAAQSPSVPEYYYSMIGLSNRFVPLFSYLDINDQGLIDTKRVEDLKTLYGPLLDRLFIIDYKRNRYEKYEMTKLQESGELSNEFIQKMIEEIANYICV